MVAEPQPHYSTAHLSGAKNCQHLVEHGVLGRSCLKCTRLSKLCEIIGLRFLNLKVYLYSYTIYAPVSLMVNMAHQEELHPHIC